MASNEQINPSSVSNKSQRKPRKPRGISLRVSVTKEIMQHSKVRDSSHCMIAEAIKEAVPEATSVSIDVQTIRFSIPSKRLRYTYLTPRIAQLAVIDFDQGKMPKPFEFRLDGAQVTTMYRRNVVSTPRSREMSPEQYVALAKAQEYNPSHATKIPDHPELVKPQFRRGKSKGMVPEKVGGRLPPTTPFARRRAFGLRALKV